MILDKCKLCQLFTFFLFSLLGCENNQSNQSDFNVDRYVIEILKMDVDNYSEVILDCYVLNNERYASELNALNDLSEVIDSFYSPKFKDYGLFNNQINHIMNYYIYQRFDSIQGDFYYNNHIEKLNINLAVKEKRELCGILKLRSAVSLIAYNSCTSELDMDNPHRW
jgi:hypothetical protein